MNFWMAFSSEVFGGYGIRAFGSTESEAKEAFFKLYTETSKKWNGGAPLCDSFEAVSDYWGVEVGEFRVGNAYFGDEGEVSGGKAHSITPPEGFTGCQPHARW